jgi:shikimate kinase
VTGKTNIYLIGPMGSGKTAVGRSLARQLGRRFFDSDAEIERRTGVDISYIFEKEGESRFRKRERDMIREMAAMSDIVLATGGGAVLDESNRKDLAATGIVVYLKTTVSQQAERTRRSKNRPLLAGEDPHAVLQKLFEIREPLYAQLADLSIETTGQRIATVVAELRSLLEQRGIRPLQK